MTRALVGGPLTGKDLRQIQRDTKAAIKFGLRNAARGSVAILAARSPKDTGQLKAGWKIRRDTQVYNDAPHAGIIEEGARPHNVSYEGRRAILEWVGRHFPQADEAERERITEGIVWKLQHYGQKGTYFVKNSIPDLQRLAVDEVVRAMDALAQERRGRRGR